MLIKQADDQSDVLAELERRAADPGRGGTFAAEQLRLRRAGIKGERDSAYLIDFEFGHSANWAVLHDLRLEHEGRVAQIDHVLINRWMDVYVLESKHFHAGVKITEHGEFLQWNAFAKSYQGMASPLEQNERHLQVLRAVMALIELPTRLGLRIAPNFHSFVLVSPRARIDRPTRFDASRVIKADQLKKAIWRDIDQESALISLFKAAKIVSRDTVEFVARQLADRHRPARRQEAGQGLAPEAGTQIPELQNPGDTSSRIDPSTAQPTPTPNLPSIPEPAPSESDSTATGPRCKQCGAIAGVILYGKFGYYFKCGQCEANTAIRFTCEPGHAPRLRKQGQQFFRECAQCSSSTLFHRNGTPT